MIRCTADLSRFKRSLQAVKAATRKDEVEIVNKAAKDIAYRAASFTPKTTAAVISASLREGDTLAKIASASLKRKKGKFTAAERNAEMRRIEMRRRSAASALRAGWAKAIIDMGGTFRGGKPNLARSAGQGFGKRATIARLVAHIRNSVVSVNWLGKPMLAERIEPLQRALIMAVAFVTADREAYAARKINATLRKHSD